MKTQISENGWKTAEISTKVRSLKHHFDNFSAFLHKIASIKKPDQQIMQLKTVLLTHLT